MDNRAKMRERLERFLEQNRISKSEFARRAGCGRSTVRNFLTGKRLVSDEMAERILKEIGEPYVGITPVERIIERLEKAKRELDAAREEVDETVHYITQQVGKLHGLKKFLNAR